MSISTRAAGAASRSAGSASTPLTPGRWLSSRIRSGCSSCARRCASPASAASPITSNSGSRASSAVRPRRNSVWSSTTRMRIGGSGAGDIAVIAAPSFGHGRRFRRGPRDRRQRQHDRRAAPGRRQHVEAGADALRPLGHDAQSHVRLVGRPVVRQRSPRRRRAPRSATAAAAARPARPASPAHACARWTAPPARCAAPAPAGPGASGMPWPCIRRAVLSPLWCSNLRSVVSSAGSMSSALARVRKCTSSSRTSP